MAKKSNAPVPSGSNNEFSNELKQTLLEHPNIKEVHFTSDGHHHFNAYKHGSKLYARVHKDKVYDKTANVVREISTPVLSSEVVKTFERSEIVGSE